MSRRTKSSESPRAIYDEDIYEASPGPNASSPASSASSDKENRSSRPSNNKAEGRAVMGPPRVPSPSGKRKRTVDRDTPSERTRRRRTVEVDEDESNLDYDPDQDIHQRRRIRKGLRDLNKSLSDNRADFYLNPSSAGLRDTLIEANNLADQVKQTADATIDARLLAQAADLTLRRTVALVSGDAAQGVDVDDFIAKCIGFMRNSEGAAAGDEAAPSSTQRRRWRNTEAEDDNGDQLNWAHLGRFACLKNNSRPSVPGFLLGPLSLEKRAKRVTVRKAAFKHSNIEETRPEVLQTADIERDENANLTTLCTQILKRLTKVRTDAINAVEDLTTDDMTEEEGDALMDRYGISKTGGIALFRFVINPYSFGQTVENLFYVSFLIRDGKLGISDDERGLPYLDLTEPRSGGDGSGGGPSKHQAVLSLDMGLWKNLIEVFDIKEPMIRHREEDEHSNVGKKGWYA